MRRISTATVTLGVFAVLAALVAAFVVRQMMHEEPVVERTPTIVVTNVHLQRGDVIQASDVALVPLAPGLIPKKEQITDLASVVGRYVKEEITAGDAVLKTKLYAIGESPSLADELAPGYRAVSIAVSGDNPQGTLIRSESLVDIALTIEGDHPELAGLAGRGIGTITLMRAVRVLDANHTNSSQRRLGTAGNNVLTVAVTAAQANELILAQRYGTLNVTLVGSQEPDQVADIGDNLVTPSKLLKFEEKPTPTPRVTEAVIYRGGTAEVVRFQEDLIAEAKAATLASERKAPVVPVGIIRAGN
jgi:Flp pilus assembly protein CpaB